MTSELISLQELKNFLRIDGETEDQNLTQMIGAAQNAAENFLQISLDKTTMSQSIKQGMMMHIAALFESRLGEITIPAASINLYKPYRIIKI